MSKWRSESGYLSRYVGSGMLNTVLGWSLIFLLMGFGVSPVWANFCGYMAGLIFGFLLNRNFVFHSKNSVAKESSRYIVAFGISFILNLLALQTCLETLNWNQNIAQAVAAVTYSGFMYVLTRYLVFNTKRAV